MNTSIFLHYLKRSVREIKKFKLSSLVNISGLTIGFTACLIIFIYVKYETSFDKFHNDYADIYRLTGAYKAENGDLAKWAATPPAFGFALKDAFPEIENSARAIRSASHTLSTTENSFRCEFILFADSTFFDILSFPLQLGNRQTALKSSNGIVLTHKLAKKLFGNENPLNKDVSVFGKNGEVKCIVTGVLKQQFLPSHLDFEAIVSYAAIVKLKGETYNSSWTFSRPYTYLKLKHGTSPDFIIGKFPRFIETHCPETKSYYSLNLQSIKDIHLKSDLTFDTRNGNETIVYWLAIIGFIVLVMAWMNYVNLSTSNIIERYRPTYISQILGAKRYYFFMSQIFQSLIINGISIVLTLLFTYLILPFISKLTGLNLLDQPRLVLFVFQISSLIVIFTSVITGVLPILFSNILRIRNNDIRVNLKIRRPLVVIQLCISIVLIIGTISIFRQFQFMSKKDMGFDIENKIILKAPVIFAEVSENYGNSIQTFKNEALKISGVEFIASSYVIPGMEVPWNNFSRDVNGEHFEGGGNVNIVDYDYLGGYKYHFIAGRNYSKEIASDRDGFILNEKAVDLLGFKSPDEAIGQKISDGESIRPIIGVIQNYHQQSLKSSYTPFVIRFDEYGRNNYTIGLNSSKTTDTSTRIENLWKKHFPNDVYDGQYLVDFFNQQYKKEYLFLNIFVVFCLLSIFIAGLGIYSMSVATAERKTKEIGIRKINGAKVSEVMLMLNKDFVKCVVVAFVIACPIAYYAMNKWLQNFAYRTELSWWVFALSGLLALVISLLTISWQSWRAARQNPVESLRSE